MAKEILAEWKVTGYGDIVRNFLADGLKIVWTHMPAADGRDAQDRYVVEGSRHDLLAAGVCDESWLPKAPKRTASCNRDRDDPEWWTIDRLQGDRLTLKHTRPDQQRSRAYARLLGGAASKRGHLRLVWSAT